MCNRCTRPEQISEDVGLFSIYNAPHAWLTEGVDRATYFASIRQALDAFVTMIAICPERSDEWLDGANVVVSRVGIDGFRVPDDGEGLPE